MGDSAAVDAVRSAAGAFNNDDIDGYLGHFDPSCRRWIAGLAQPLTVTEVGESLRRLRATFGELRLDADGLFGDERFACARWRLYGRSTPEPSIDIETCEVYEVSDELIINTWVYGHLGELPR